MKLTQSYFPSAADSIQFEYYLKKNDDDIYLIISIYKDKYSIYFKEISKNEVSSNILSVLLLDDVKNILKEKFLKFM